MNILLIDGGQAFRFTEGRLNHTLHQTAREILTALGHAVKETVIERAMTPLPRWRNGCGWMRLSGRCPAGGWASHGR